MVEGSGAGVLSSHCTRILTRTRVVQDQTSYTQCLSFSFKEWYKISTYRREAKLPNVESAHAFGWHVLTVPCQRISQFILVDLRETVKVKLLAMRHLLKPQL